MEMKIVFIGSGAAFTSNNYHSNILIQLNNKNLLLDCGSDARFALRDSGYCFRDIDSIYISHIHADHVGGLEWIGFTRKFDPAASKLPNIISHRNILDNLWEHSLSAGMQTLDDEEAKLESYFNPVPLTYPGYFVWEEVKFELVKTLHVKNHEKVLDSYGLFFVFNNKKVFITTDTRLLFDEFLPYYTQSDIIFHDCETQYPLSTVHAHYDELVTLPAEIKKKMWLYHYNSSVLPDAVSQGFCGFVAKGQEFVV